MSKEYVFVVGDHDLMWLRKYMGELLHIEQETEKYFLTKQGDIPKYLFDQPNACVQLVFIDNEQDAEKIYRQRIAFEQLNLKFKMGEMKREFNARLDLLTKKQIAFMEALREA